MGIDELDLLRFGHRVGDPPGGLEQGAPVDERPSGDEAGQEAGRTLEERGQGRRGRRWRGRVQGGEIGRAEVGLDHQPPASRTIRWRIRAATIRR